MYTLRRTGVKGCIINYDKTSLIELFGCMNDFDKCNCLITNIECCPADREISEIMDAEYCWIDGKELLRFIEKRGLPMDMGSILCLSEGCNIG